MRAYCQKCKAYPQTLIAQAITGIDEEGHLIKEESQIILANDGTCSNQWADGAFGVPEDIAHAAEEDETPLCAECLEYVTWEH